MKQVNTNWTQENSSKQMHSANTTYFSSVIKGKSNHIHITLTYHWSPSHTHGSCWCALPCPEKTRSPRWNNFMSCPNYANRDAWESAEITGVIIKSWPVRKIGFITVLCYIGLWSLHSDVILTNSRQYLATVASRYCTRLDNVAHYVAGEHFTDTFISI